MDGSSLSLIIIPVVTVIFLAAWLIAVAYAARHPAWKHGPAAPRQAPATALPGAAVPLPRTEIPCPVRQPAELRPMVTAGTNEACDRCGPAVRAAYRVAREGELYLCGHCTNQLSPALSAQGWAIWSISECAGRSPASYRSPAAAGSGGQDAAEMAAEADAELGGRGPERRYRRRAWRLRRPY